MPSRNVRLGHIQIAAPPGCEAAAREFYGSLLGMPEIQKPGPASTARQVRDLPAIRDLIGSVNTTAFFIPHAG